MSELASRIGVRMGYDADSGSALQSHIKNLPVNGKSPTSIEHQHHHSKCATSKLKSPNPPSHVLFSALDSQPPSLLSRLDMYTDGTSGHGDVVPLIDRIFRTEGDPQSREPSSPMKNPIFVEELGTPHTSMIGNGSLVNAENATPHLRKRSGSKQLNGKTLMPRLKLSTQPLHFPSAASEEFELHIHENRQPTSTARKPLDKGSPFLVPTNSDVWVPGNSPSNPTPTFISQIRDVLLPLVVYNAQAQPGMENARLDRIRNKAKVILTDSACESFVGRMQSIERQMQAHTIQRRESKSCSSAAVETVVFPAGIPSTASLTRPLGEPGLLLVPSSSMPPSTLIAIPSGNGHLSSLPTPPVSAPLPNTPKAPKAMRLHEFMYGSPQQAFPRPPSRKGKEKADPYDPLCYNHADVARVDLDVHDAHLQTSGPSGIAIPMDSEFFERPIKDSAGGDSVGTYHHFRHRSLSLESQAFPSPPSGRSAPPSRRYLSRSPDGYHSSVHQSSHHHVHRRRSPYRSRSRSRSPVRLIAYGPKPAHHGHELDHLSISKDLSRIDKSEGIRQRSRRKNSRSRLRQSHSPEYRRLDHVQNRVHRPRSPLQSVSRSPQPHHRKRDTTPPDYRGRDSSYSAPKSNYTSRSRSKSGPHYRMHGSREREQSVNNIVYGPARPPKVEKAVNLQPLRNPRSLAQVMEPCRNVPGLWFIKMGEESVRVMECQIEIDHETSVKWNLDSIYLPKPEKMFRVQPQQRLLSLRLMCIPTQVIRSTYKSSDLGTATSEEIATKVLDLENVWPRKGTLIVVVNPQKTWGKTWLPIDLDPDGPALDLTTCICEGTNVVRIIQLADMADKVFVLCAVLPTARDPDEEYSRDVPKHLTMSPGPLKLRPAIVEVA